MHTNQRNVLKNLVLKVHPGASLYSKIRPRFTTEPFICVITPIFDPALDSLKRLIQDLEQQTFENFIHVIVSNGASPAIDKYIKYRQKIDNRFVYCELPNEQVSDYAQLIVNTAKRRDYCLKHFNAERYIFIDADARVVDTALFAKLYVAHKVFKKEIIVSEVEYHGRTLPIFPIAYGHITISNYIFSKKIAKKYRYPTNYDAAKHISNDYRYWEKISKHENCVFLHSVGIHEGEVRDYKRMTDIMLDELANRPMISVFGNDFTYADKNGVSQVLDSHLVGLSEKVHEFEDSFSKLIGFRYGVATNSCTNAFWVLLRAINLKPGDEVIMPSLHFFGVANVLKLLKLKVRFVDVQAEIPNIDADKLIEKICSKTRAILCLDYGGHPADIKKIKSYLSKISRDDIYLILDAANSPFTTVHNQFIATEYDFALYSFDMNKIIVTGEGGMILSNHKIQMDHCRSLGYYGITSDTPSGFTKSAHETEWWKVGASVPSLKLNMNAIAASLGLTQLDNWRDKLHRRRIIIDLYNKKLSSLAKKRLISLPKLSPEVTHAAYLYWIRLQDKQTRNALAQYLLKKKIYSTVKYEPLTTTKDTPLAWKFFETSLCLPLNQNLSETDVDYIVSHIIGFFDEAI